MSAERAPIAVLRPGLVPYGQALALQLRLREELIVRAQQGDTSLAGYLVCLEHPPVVTLGKRGRPEDITGLPLLRAYGAEVFQTDRGGEVTYHGPGQLVVYPIVRLEWVNLGVVDLIRGLATCLAESLAGYGVEARYDVEHPGLWTIGPEISCKIASVGMRVSRGVTTHGAAINLVNDMSPFSMIVPCGMPDAPMARLVDLANPVKAEREVAVSTFIDAFLEHFGQFLDREFVASALPLPDVCDWVLPETM